MPDGPKGIGGWLILQALGLILTPFVIGYQLYRGLPLLAPETWNSLTNSSSPAYHPLWAPFILIELAANLALLAYTLGLIWLFFKKSKRVPTLFIAWLLLLIGVQLVDFLLAGRIPAIASSDTFNRESIRDLIRSLVHAAIWIPYWIRSRRVRNTFTEPV